MRASKWNQTKESSFHLKGSELCVEANHFILHVYNSLPQLHFDAKHHITGKTCGTGNPQIITTLDGTLQNRVKDVLSTTLKNLKSHNVANGAVLIAEHGTGEIVAWVVASNYSSKSLYNTRYIDAIKALRQPGSAMKPFLYALALEKGWSAATLIDDSPLKEPVGVGIHTYHNYSNIHYGVVTLRNALGNSLNIPAVKTIRFTGVDTYLKKLKKLGITTLTRHPDFYGDGLALGNGEVSIYDMVQAYSVFANAGEFIPLSPFYDSELKQALQSGRLSSWSNSPSSAHLSRRDGRISSKPLFSEEVTSIIGNILSDPGARELEFGGNDLLNFPVQTAVKTGTSSDYRDAWAMGYNRRYTAGVWMGNLDGSSTVELTGSKGPAFVLRSLFAELNRMRTERGEDYGNRPLYMSPDLVQKDICLTHTAEGECLRTTEWFVPGSEMDSAAIQVSRPVGSTLENTSASNKYDHYKKDHYTDQEGQSHQPTFGLINPVNGLEVAMDPRIPDELEYMEFKVAGALPEERIRWTINGEALNIEGVQISELNCSDSNLLKSRALKLKGSKFNNTIQWKTSRGYHRVSIELIDKSERVKATQSVSFLVK